MTSNKSTGFFAVACRDAARIVSILSLNSADVTKPRSVNSFWVNAYEKYVFFFRFFYMVFIKGFTPTIFDMLPYWAWKFLTTSIYLYRLIFVPILLKFTGYGDCANWASPSLGSMQPSKSDIASGVSEGISLTVEGRLASVRFGDPEFESLLAALHAKSVHLSPHSQSPGHPFVSGFPGNFMDHLTGVFKILLGNYMIDPETIFLRCIILLLRVLWN
jgi:hypothetical protein